jgi:hypothetical protein
MRLILVTLLLVLVFTLASKYAFAVDEPVHSIILKDKSIELRQYEPTIVASVVVAGDMDEASGLGFRSLADYIFGNNKPAKKIAMTAPVTRTENQNEQSEVSTKIAMTSPVTRVQKSDSLWTVTFIMPAKWSIESLPQPNNDRVMIQEVPGELIAALKFSGQGQESTHRAKQRELERWIAEQGYEAIGPPRYAGYDAPWVIWPLRRNEVMIPVIKKS